MASKMDDPFPEVIQSRDKAKQLWDAAVPVTIESCSKMLGNMEKSKLGQIATDRVSQNRIRKGPVF